MKRVLLMVVTSVLIGLVCSPALAAKGTTHRWWFGGGVGLAFGDVDYVSIEPVLGYSITPQLSAGARLSFRYRSDNRYDREISTNDYGAGLFLRYLVSRPFYVQAEYEYLSYEIPAFDGSSEREGYDSVFGGFGLAQPLGRNTAFFATILYNFLWQDDEPSPYADRWVFRAGVSVSF